mgnify:CR=1 FL=1
MDNQKEFYSAKIYFFDAMGKFLGLRTIQMENIGRKTLKLSELLTDELVSAKTFAVFHPNVDGENICLDILKSHWSPALKI